MATVFKRGGHRHRGGRYYVSFFDHNGNRVTRSARTTDRSAAERIASKLETDAALRRDRVIDPSLDAISRESRRTIESHLIDYESKLHAGGRTKRHINSVVGFIRTIARLCQWQSAADIEPDGLHRYVQTIRDEGRSAQTIKNQLTAIKAFTNWLTKHDKLARNPLASVTKPNPKMDRRLERRMLLPDEWTWLRATALAGADRFGMSGNERMLLYALAIQTGLRSNELRSLTRTSLFLDRDPSYVLCKGKATKNRKDARQFIQASLACELRAHIAAKVGAASVFNLPPAYEMADMIRADLAEARTAWQQAAGHDAKETLRRQQSDFLLAVSHAGERIDFHSLRHTCGAWLAMTGAHPKTVQSVMRHSSIVLTMDTYGHLFPGDEAMAIMRLPAMLPRDQIEERATGAAARSRKRNTKRSTKRSSGGAKRCAAGATPCDERTANALSA